MCDFAQTANLGSVYDWPLMNGLSPGHWYLMFSCVHCQERQILFPDLTNGTSDIRGSYTVRCERCGLSGKYDTKAIERYRHSEHSQPAEAVGREELLSHRDTLSRTASHPNS